MRRPADLRPLHLAPDFGARLHAVKQDPPRRWRRVIVTCPLCLATVLGDGRAYLEPDGSRHRHQPGDLHIPLTGGAHGPFTK